MVICQAFRTVSMYKRWKVLAATYQDIDVTLIGPAKWEDQAFGKISNSACTVIEEPRFRVVPVDMIDCPGLGAWWDAPGVTAQIKKYRPNFIYIIGVRAANILFRVAIAKQRFVPHAKICGFSMQGLDAQYKKIDFFSGLGNARASLIFRTRWKLASFIYDAIFTHYPRGVELLRTQMNYKKPIYMQTQVGVDSTVFKPNKEARARIRKKWGVKDEFLFGSLSRINCQKGLLDILDVLPLDGKSKFMMIGDGPDLDLIKKEVKKRNLSNYVIFPGYVQHHEMASDYLNALDGLVHVPPELPKYIDTFPLAVAESMAVGIPVIGTQSGGIPYQLGGKGIVVPIGDKVRLRSAMNDLVTNNDKAKRLGLTLRVRLMESFEMHHINACFYYTMQDVIKGKFNPQHADQQAFTFE